MLSGEAVTPRTVQSRIRAECIHGVTSLVFELNKNAPGVSFWLMPNRATTYQSHTAVLTVAFRLR